jgi:spore coat polysaccharide biosynthesis protein SpsF (cytidylyltransferase family)
MTGCIIQARMRSSRLPGKVLKPITGKPLLYHLLSRIKNIKKSEICVIATTTDTSDDIIEEFGAKNSIPVFRGSTDDVMQRYINAAKKYNVDTIVRICADTPIIAPDVIDEMINKIETEKLDYCGIENENNFALTGVEAFTLNALEKQLLFNPKDYHKEHVSVLIRERDDFKKGKIKPDKSLVTQEVRLTVDTPADFELIKKVFEHFKSSDFPLKDAISFVLKNSSLKKINAHIHQKDIHQPSYSVCLVVTSVDEELKKKFINVFTEKHHIGFKVIYVSLDDPHFNWADFAEEASKFNFALYDKNILGLTFTSPSKAVNLAEIDPEKAACEIKSAL